MQSKQQKLAEPFVWRYVKQSGEEDRFLQAALWFEELGNMAAAGHLRAIDKGTSEAAQPGE